MAGIRRVLLAQEEARKPQSGIESHWKERKGRTIPPAGPTRALASRLASMACAYGRIG